MLPPKNASGMPVVPKNLDNRDLELFLQNVRQVLTGQKSTGGKGSDIYLEPAVKRYFDQMFYKTKKELQAYFDEQIAKLKQELFDEIKRATDALRDELTQLIQTTKEELLAEMDTKDQALKEAIQKDYNEKLQKLDDDLRAYVDAKTATTPP